MPNNNQQEAKIERVAVKEVVVFSKKNHTKKKRLLKDIVIPAGTILENCDGTVTTWVGDNYTTSAIGLTKNTAGRFVYGVDSSQGCKEELKEWFEDVP